MEPRMETGVCVNQLCGVRGHVSEDGRLEAPRGHVRAGGQFKDDGLVEGVVQQTGHVPAEALHASLACPDVEQLERHSRHDFMEHDVEASTDGRVIVIGAPQQSVADPTRVPHDVPKRVSHDVPGSIDVEFDLSLSRSNNVEPDFFLQLAGRVLRDGVKGDEMHVVRLAGRVIRGAMKGDELHVAPQSVPAKLSLLQRSHGAQSHGQAKRTTRSWKKSACQQLGYGAEIEPVLQLGKRSTDVLGDVVRSVHRGKKGKKSDYALSLVDEVGAEAESQPRHHQ
jgi:hypothetical protein